MDLERDGNLIEAGVWFLLALVLCVYTFFSNRRVRFILWFLSITLAVFGVSDLVEARTGAWWKPWWLFVWKAACVGGLLLGFALYYRLTKKAIARAKKPPETIT
jgi:succinate-acetate transporter protein